MRKNGAISKIETVWIQIIQIRIKFALSGWTVPRISYAELYVILMNFSQKNP